MLGFFISNVSTKFVQPRYFLIFTT